MNLYSLNAHIFMFMDKNSIYKIDKIWLIQFQNQHYISKENCSFERRPSGRKPKFEESIRQKIIDLVL